MENIKIDPNDLLVSLYTTQEREKLLASLNVCLYHNYKMTFSKADAGESNIIYEGKPIKAEPGKEDLEEFFKAVTDMFWRQLNERVTPNERHKLRLEPEAKK